MKKLLIAVLLTSAFAQTKAQEKNKELYISTNSFTTLTQQIDYRSQLKSGKYLRLTFGSGQLRFLDHTPRSSTQFPESAFNVGFSGSIGLEKRNDIAEKVEFFKGLNLILSPDYTIINSRDPITLAPDQTHSYYSLAGGVSAHFGIKTIVKDRLILGAIYEPALIAHLDEIGDATRFGSSLFFGPSQVRLMIGFKWNKVED